MNMATKISIFILIFILSAFKGRIFAANVRNCSSEVNCKCELEQHNEVTFYKAICSYQNLLDFPHFIESVRWIDLAYNNISSLGNIERMPKDLLSLNLSNNPIVDVTSRPFRKFHKLDELILQNLQNLDISSVQSDFLHGLKGLKTLDVKGWIITSGEYPTDLLEYVPTLQDLRINGLQKPFSSGMRKLIHLRRLDLSGVIGECHVNSLHSLYFENVRSITHLDVSYCHLTEIHRNSISKFKFLHSLDVSYNDEMTFRVLKNISSELELTKIEVLKLDKIHCTFGVGTEIMRGDLTNVTKTPLRYLSLNSNRLEMIQKGVLLMLPSTLQHISVADNKFTIGSFMYEVMFLSNVTTLNASFCAQTHIPTFHYNCHEKKNCRCDTSTKYPVNHYFDEKEYEYLCKMSEIQRNPFIDCFPLPRSVKNIFIAQSNLRYTIPSIKLCRNNVRDVRLQGNILSKWIGPIENVENVTYLDLSNNVCTEVSTYFFEFFKGLEYLDVSRNLLGDSMKTDIYGETFQYLKPLKYLDLSLNRINVLSPKIFKSLVNLKHLKLRDNLIADFNVELKHLSGLSLLDLSGNQLLTLNVDIRSSLGDIRKHSHLKINIARNPLRCNCEDIDFWRWISNSDFILNSHEVTCRVGRLKQFFKNSSKLADTIMEMDKVCASYVGIVAGVSCTIGILIALIIGGTVYRYRWKLRYLFYMTKSKYFGYAEIGRDYTERNFIYDCFISYADEDRGFALHYMMNYLEKISGLKLCFHQRDFMPGIDIAQNITNAIHQSRKTICVLSPNYLNSYWCMYELNMAKMESIYSRNGENILILVFYKHVSPDDIPLNVMSIIEQKSYIEYPGDEQGDVVFWNKLKEVIEL